MIEVKKYLKSIIVILTITLSCSSGNDTSIDNNTEQNQEEDFEILEDKYEVDNSFKVVGYFPNYRFNVASDIDYTKLTHLNFIKAYPSSAGSLVYDNQGELASTMTSIRKQNPNIKIAMTLGGGSLTASQIEAWGLYTKPEYRKILVDNIVKYVVDNNLDGVDIDIEGNLLGVPKGITLKNYGVLIKHLKNDLHAVGKFISVALPATENRGISSEIINEYDFVNIMCYGRANKQLLSFAESSVDFWLNTMRIDKKKLVLGLPFFGWTTESTPKSYIYRNSVIDDVKNAFNDREGLNNHNSIPTIMKKVILAKDKLNGVMIWEVGQDSFDELSLLKAVGETVSASNNCTNENIEIYYRDSDNDGFGDISKPQIACSEPLGYVANNEDCDDSAIEIGNCG